MCEPVKARGPGIGTVAAVVAVALAAGPVMAVAGSVLVAAAVAVAAANVVGLAGLALLLFPALRPAKRVPVRVPKALPAAMPRAIEAPVITVTPDAVFRPGERQPWPR